MVWFLILALMMAQLLVKDVLMNDKEPSFKILTDYFNSHIYVTLSDQSI